MSFRIIALTPSGRLDPSLAIAASRAGELGVLSLERALDPAAAAEAMDAMARLARGECGARLGGDAPSFEAIVARMPPAVKTVILTRFERTSLAARVRALRDGGRTVLLEVTSLEEGRLGEQAGVDGLVAKGHEAGGWVGEETAFVLLQHLLGRLSLPVWAYGGIGLHTAAAAHAAGASGVVLDAQLALTRESSLPEPVKEAIGRMDGSETLCLGGELGASFRFHARPGQASVESLRGELGRLHGEGPAAAREAEWRRVVDARAGWGSPDEQLWPLGQDAAFAAPLARQFHTVAGVLAGLRQAIDTHVEAAKACRPLDAEGPLAKAHGTRHPIVQGPMTRVSDRAEFALRVAEGGGLPFLALALMRADEVDSLLQQTQRLLAGRPWGVGILGFVPLELRQEQLEAIRAYRPPFALIAGGRPDQARALEKDGIPTYLHVPSPGLLRLFLQDGARRFVFEGRECGGHVGPRSSFVLWNLMIDVLLEALPASELGSCHVLFAGGVHDALSASMVAAMAAPLAERGAKIGVLLGTAYLFTEEAVAAGAIVKGFQDEAVRCARTVLLETGPGHSTRCADTAFADVFVQEKQRLLGEGRSPEEIRNELELLNIGRLRLASKGVQRHPRFGEDAQAPKLLAVEDDEQRRQGMYMIGQVAALRERTCTVDELHRSVSVEGTRRLEALAPVGAAAPAPCPAARPSEVAVIGISCMLPKARDRRTYWENILNKVSGITEIPKERWDWELYFDADPRARDKIYSKWGGFLEDEPFDPVEFGMPPNSLASIDPMQLLALKVARAALRDAGYLDRPFDRARTSVILGASGGIGDLGGAYLLRSSLPMLFGEAAPDLVAEAGLPEWTEDSFAGLLLNVAAGRIANRLDVGGLNYVVDAACASSLAAVHLAVKELETRNTDMVLVGGVDTTQNPFGYLCFSKTRALSPTGQPRTFDASADGIAISEGIVMLLLKRLADAERDGDRIYAVIQGVGGSSDGRAKGLTAPRPEGQMLALQRAYAKAGISPTTVGLFEAHGTGTVVGDRAEALALTTILEEAGASPESAAIGSVKSMIGHTKATAGVAGLAKVALALYHKVLPPTLGVAEPNPKARFGDGPLYVNSEARPWVHGTGSHPRRAGVNAFGFGGTNFHAILEEYTGEFLSRESVTERRPSELFLWSAGSRAELAAALESLEKSISRGAQPPPADLALTLWQEVAGNGNRGATRLAIVASSLDDLRQKLGEAGQALGEAGPVPRLDPRGIYLCEEPLAQDGKLAFLFPGQGSQYPNMLKDLAIEFGEVRDAFERADRALSGRFPRPLSAYVYPRPAFTPDDERAQQQALTATNVAQPALGAADMGVSALLRALGVEPDLVAGHSYGEYVALTAAGVLSEQALAAVSEARGRSILEAATQDLGTMAAVEADAEAVRRALAGLDEVWLANLNSPEQTIVSGSRAGIEHAVQRMKEQGLRARPVPVACAFHSPLVAPARERLAEFLAAAEFAPPRIAVFSNTTAAPYPAEPQGIAALLAEHLVQPVRFADEIEAMYEAGARIFVEVGPRNVLVNLVRQTLGARPHVAIAVDATGRPGLTQLHHALGQLAVQGVSVRLDRLFEGRAVHRLNLRALEEDTRERPLSATTWMVNGAGVRPARAPEVVRRMSRLAVPSAHASGNGSGRAAGNGNGAGQATGNGNGNGNGALPAALFGLEAAAPAKLNGSSAAQVASPAAPRPLPSGAASTAAPPIAPDASAEVMQQFQGLMGRFLDTQRKVMLAYLQGASIAAPEAGIAPRLAAADATAPAALLEPVPTAASPAPPPVATETAPAPAIPVPVVSTPVGADAAAGAGRASKDQLTGELLRIVGERTGYPPELLDLDVDIEADLGIDSIKRVEILGNVQRACIPPEVHVGEKSMEQLTGIKTLRGIADWLERALENGSGPPSEPVAASAGPASPTPPSAPVEKAGAPQAAQPTSQDELVVIPRSTLAVVDAPPLRGHAGRFAPDRVFLITDDERGLAHTVGAELSALGGRVVLLRHAIGLGAEGQIEPGIYQADLTDAGTAGRLVDLVRREHGPIGGIVHLLPLAEREHFEAMDLAGWRAALARDVKSLFHVARASAHDLRQAGDGRGAWVLAATTMGAAYEEDPSLRRPFFPGQGGIAGLVKTLALEWPGVHCKVVGLDADDPAALHAEQVLGELTAGDGLVEVGYSGARRRTLQPRLVPLDPGGPLRLAIDSDWVILVTGGARGITAEVAAELAERYRPTLVLVGRSPLPEPDESPATRELASPQGLKAALMESMRRGGQAVTVAGVEAAYQRLLKDREIRASLARMERAGSKVRYHQADARDEPAMRSLVEETYREHGRLDGVIHGAGVIEDRLVEDKTAESFDRVFDTKTESAFVLSRVLRAESLRFLALFGSASGPFGNRGQSDYAAANEILNKLALHLGRSWPGRVFSISWGPWQKTGMVSPELQREFARRGIELISIPTGCRLFDQELRHGGRDHPEVILAGGAWSAPRTEAPATRARALPLLHGATFAKGGGHIVEATRTLDPSHDLYLLDHRIDDLPVLPLAVAMELMAELVQHSWPDLEVVGVRELQLLKGVVLDDGPKAVRLVARAQAEPLHDRPGIDVNVEIREANGMGHPHYRATVELAPHLPAPPPYVCPSSETLQPFPMTAAEAYGRWLFHGPRLQGITEIEGIAGRSLHATLNASSPPPFLRDAPSGQWLIDPVMFDSGLQLFLLWARAHLDKTPLPSRFQRYRRFGSLSQSKVRCRLQILDRSSDPLYYMNLAFVGPDGRLLGLLEEAEGACSRSLNRLAVVSAARRSPTGVVGESPSV